MKKFLSLITTILLACLFTSTAFAETTKKENIVILTGDEAIETALEYSIPISKDGMPLKQITIKKTIQEEDNKNNFAGLGNLGNYEVMAVRKYIKVTSVPRLN
jgi:hypothetical protein